MTIGMRRPIVTKIVAGPMSMPAVESRPPRFSRAASDTRVSAVADAVIAMTDPRVSAGLEFLVPEVLQVPHPLGQELEVRVDEELLLFGRETDALPQVRGDLRVIDHRVVTHVDGEAFLGGGLQRRIEKRVGPGLVRRIFRNCESGNVADDA